MVTQRRVGPLLVLLGVLLACLLARAFQVQVLEHGIWAGEAAAMEQSSEVLPYRRGRILDRNGLELARDQEQFEIRLCYRDFRRGSAIAQVAHARSSLEMRAVTLGEAEQHLEAWANELVHLRPRELYAFARGAALAGGAASEIAPEEARSALRERRADDLRYYAGELLELEPRLRPRFKPAADGQLAESTLLEIAARARGLAPQALESQLQRTLAASRARLAHLAELIERDAQQPAGSGRGALARLLELLETERREIEDDTADALFHEAAGFGPGRVRTRLLEQRFDTSWIGRALRWDDARRHEWIASRRTQWEHVVAEVLLPRILLRAQEEPIRTRRPDRLLSELALLWTPEGEDLRASDGQPRSWLEFDEPVVLCELDSLYERSSGARAPEETRSALPFEDEELEQLAQEEPDHWRVVGALADLARGAAVELRVGRFPDEWHPPAGPAEAAQRWRRIALGHRRLDDDAGMLELTWLWLALEARFQDEVERQLDLVYEQCGASAPLPFDEQRRAHAAEAERYVLRDRSTRPVVICRSPSWDQIQLVTRGAGDYDGFRSATTSLRLHPEHDKHGVELAQGLVGSVRRPSLSDLLAQGRERARLAELRTQLVRSSAEESELRDLAARLYRNDEWTGGTGVEGWLDSELRGRNGYRESFSMAGEALAAESELTRAALDGADVQLTIDVALQRAAQEVLADPQMPNGDESDQLWCRNPVGAIVLLTPEGDVLAAASAPTQDGLPPTPGRDREHSHLRERSLQRPTGTPPGSCFKPFVAAYALERLKLERGRSFGCGDLKDGGKGYGTIHCHGHGTIALRDALVASCNAYFGQLAEACYQPEDFLAMAHLFGFGEPTGLSPLNERGRARLREDYAIPGEAGLPKQLQDRGNLMRFSCGLFPMEATPMQVARATAGLATGTLPEVRLVQQIGGVEQPQRSRPLGISESTLEFVRGALEGVVREAKGTAHIGGLSEERLHFTFACKTGSADISPFVDNGDLTEADKADMQAGKWRKHTWIAGWFPAEKPRAILVVYLHDVSETATRTSVYVAAQFLQTEAVQRFAGGEEPKR